MSERPRTDHSLGYNNNSFNLYSSVKKKKKQKEMQNFMVDHESVPRLRNAIKLRDSNEWNYVRKLRATKE